MSSLFVRLLSCCRRSLTHSLTHPPTVTHSLTHSLTEAGALTSVRSLHHRLRSFVPSFVRSFIRNTRAGFVSLALYLSLSLCFVVTSFVFYFVGVLAEVRGSCCHLRWLLLRLFVLSVVRWPRSLDCSASLHGHDCGLDQWRMRDRAQTFVASWTVKVTVAARSGRRWR